MQKVIQSLIAGVVVVAVAASALFFCCAEKITLASSLKITNIAADYCCKGDQADHPKEGKSCPCFFKANTVSQAQLSARSFIQFNAFNSPEAILSFVQTVYTVSLRTDHPDVPSEKYCSVPRFLQYRSIRI